jgi:hypothetical protein
MRPTAIPEHLVDEQRISMQITVPDDLAEHVDPVTALVDKGPDGMARISIPIALEDGELRTIRSTGVIWVSFLGGVTPFSLSVTPPGEE